MAFATSLVTAQGVTVELAAADTYVTTSAIRIGDVASVISQSSLISDKVRNLLLDEFPFDKDTVPVSLEQIRWLVLLNGISPDQVVTKGLPNTMVHHHSGAETDFDVTKWIGAEIARGFGAPAEHVQISVEGNKDLDEVRAAWKGSGMDGKRVRLPLRLLPGRQNLTIEITTAERATSVFNVPVILTLNRNVAIARRPIAANAIISEEDIQTMVRPIDDPQVRPASAEEIIGKPARREIHAYELITSAELAPVRATAEAIRRGQLIRVTQTIGPVSIVVPHGKALQNGQIGDVIQVENPSTGKSMICRVTSDSTGQLVR